MSIHERPSGRTVFFSDTGVMTNVLLQGRKTTEDVLYYVYDNKQKERSLDMPAPRLNMPEYEPDDWSKVLRIMRQLEKMGYEVNEARTIVQVIETFNLDKLQFNFPYDSFEEFKKHVLAGEFDSDNSHFYATEEKCEQLRKDVEEGRLCRQSTDFSEIKTA